MKPLAPAAAVCERGAAGAPRLRATLRAAFFLPLSFAWSGAINVLPQVWLVEHGVERRSFWLSVLLLCGTLLAVGGVALSQLQLARGRAVGPAGISLGTAAWLLPFVAAPFLHSPAAYAAAYLGFRATSNWLYNHLDQRMVRVEGDGHTGAYVSGALGFQIAGTTLGPPLFASLQGRPALAASITVAVAVAGVLPALAAPEPAPGARTSGHAGAAGRPASELRFHLFAFVTLGAVIAFASQLVFLLRDVYAVPDATRAGGLLLGLVGLVAAVTALPAATLLRRRRADPQRAFAPAAGLFTAGILLFAWRPVPGVGWLVLPCTVAGLAYGAFLAASRLYATGRARRDPGVLSAYNNMPNLASLGAYGFTAVLSVAVGHDPAAFGRALLAALAAGFALAWLLGARTGSAPRPAGETP